LSYQLRIIYPWKKVDRPIAMSAEPEKIFSSTGRMVPPDTRRGYLKANIIGAAACLKRA
jgi:hypothetical protein